MIQVTVCIDAKAIGTDALVSTCFHLRFQKPMLLCQNEQLRARNYFTITLITSFCTICNNQLPFCSIVPPTGLRCCQSSVFGLQKEGRKSRQSGRDCLAKLQPRHQEKSTKVTAALQTITPPTTAPALCELIKRVHPMTHQNGGVFGVLAYALT